VLDFETAAGQRALAAQELVELLLHEADVHFAAGLV
jgi:hypothetical protein